MIGKLFRLTWWKPGRDWRERSCWTLWQSGLSLWLWWFHPACCSPAPVQCSSSLGRLTAEQYKQKIVMKGSKHISELGEKWHHHNMWIYALSKLKSLDGDKTQENALRIKWLSLHVYNSGNKKWMLPYHSSISCKTFISGISCNFTSDFGTYKDFNTPNTFLTLVDREKRSILSLFCR